MRYVFIVNPHAGEKSGEQSIRASISHLPQSKDCEVYVTKAPGDATRFVRQWCTTHPGQKVRFIGCGGDGTLNEVCNGAVGFDQASVSCYPCGSGNDFVKTFGGASVFLDCERLATAPTRRIDLLEVHDCTGAYPDRYSVNVVNFGFDTTVARTVNNEREKTGHGDAHAYIRGVLIALCTSMKNECTVRADDEVLDPADTMLLCTVANGEYVGGSFHCAPKSKPDDGLIEVSLIKPISRLRVPLIFKSYSRGTYLDDPRMRDVVVHRQARRVEVTAPAGFAFSLDGEIIQTPHFTIGIAPKVLDFAVPR